MPRGSAFPKPTKIRVEVGKPMFIKREKGKVKEEIYRFTEEMREIVCGLLDKAGKT